MTRLDPESDAPAPFEDDPDSLPLGLAAGRFHATVVERMPIGVQVWRLKPARDPAAARLVAVNPAAARLTGVVIEASLGRSMADCFPAFCQQGLPAKLADILERRRTKLLGQFRADRPDAPEAQVTLRGFRLPNRCVGVTIEPAGRRGPTAARP